MSTGQYSPSLETTLVVMLGVSKCPGSPHLADLPGSRNAADSFYEYLTRDFGLAEENINDLFDSRRSPSEQLRTIGDWLFGKKDKLRDLLVFYTGHGGFTPTDRKFFLATRSTTEQLEGGTSIRIVDLATVLKTKAPWARKFLIFDCCFAASVVADFMSSPGSVAFDKTKDVFPPTGTAILCSSSSQDISIASVGDKYTRFSEALLWVLREGNARVDTALSLWDIAAQCRERILEKYPEDRMRPEIHSPDQPEGDIATEVRIFPNLSLKRKAETGERAEKEQLEAERRQREEQGRVAAEQRQREEQRRLAAINREREEQERLAAAHDRSKSNIPPRGSVPSENPEPGRPEIVPIAEKKGSTKQRRLVLFALLALILILGLWGLVAYVIIYHIVF